MRTTATALSVVPALCVVMALCPVTRADHTFPSFTSTVGYEDVVVPFDVSAVPPGDYAGYSITVEWQPLASTPYRGKAIDARWMLAQPGHAFLLAAAGASPDAVDDYDDQVITWSGSFIRTYHGGDPLALIGYQELQGPGVWGDVSLTLISGTVPPPTPPVAMQLGDVSAWTPHASMPLMQNFVRWLRFSTPQIDAFACDNLRLDTSGSAVAGGSYRSGIDLELGLYNADGLLVATNDDIDQLGGDLLSAISFGADEDRPVASAGDLPAGDYYLAVAGFDAEFGLGGFSVTSNSPVTGTVELTIAYGQPYLDCNDNGAADVCDIAGGISADVNSTGIPDECEDCNVNGILDDAEIAAGSSTDCNGDGVPDSCQVSGDIVTRFYVDADATGANNGLSWEDAFTELRTALDYLPCGEVSEVWVAEGIYHPGGGAPTRRTSFELADGLSIYGGFAGVEDPSADRDPRVYLTVLSGDLEGNDPADVGLAFGCLGHHAPLPLECVQFDVDTDGWIESWEVGWDDNSERVVVGRGVGSTTRLDGFTIAGGWNEGWLAGGGIYLEQSSATIANCIVQRNFAAAGGGAFNAGGAPTYENCMFLENTASDSDWSYISSGGGMANEESDAVVVNTSFIRNAAMRWPNHTSPDSRGGGVYNDGGSPQILNCLFVCNRAEPDDGGLGGAVYNTSAQARVANSILWQNSATEDSATGRQIAGDTTGLLYSIVQDWTPAVGGQGNIASPPRFTDRDGADNLLGTEDDDWTLSPHSPAIDAGTTGLVPTWAWYDAGGGSRVGDDSCVEDTGVWGVVGDVHGVVDMGPRERFVSQNADEGDCDGDGFPDACAYRQGRRVFVDRFPGDTVDPANWLGEPDISLIHNSAPYSMTATSGVESRRIDLSHADSAELRLAGRCEWLSPGDPFESAGIRYWDGDTWQPLILIGNDDIGVYEGRWLDLVFALPQAALHRDFKIGFDTANGYWLVDDVEVTVAPVDCNSNDQTDECDILLRRSLDLNNNDFPDECDSLGDLDGDGVVGLLDYAVFESCMTGPMSPFRSACPIADFDQDFDVDLVDFARFAQLAKGQ